MNAQKMRTSLERALRTTISSAEWAYLIRIGLLREYETSVSDWSEFRRGVEDNLINIRRFRDDDLREQAGELMEEPREYGVDHQSDNVQVDLDDRTLARSHALGALNQLRSGGTTLLRPTMTGVLLPRGGVDGTVPQWVYVIAAELWMPAEEVARAFRTRQRTLMVETGQPKTQSRAFEVARFVWEVELAYGERPSWPVLCKLWNDRCKRWNNAPMARRFDHWRDFRTYFLRGEKATLPRYRAHGDEITAQVREVSSRGESAVFNNWARNVLAATLQPSANRGSSGSNTAAIETRTRLDAPGL